MKRFSTVLMTCMLVMVFAVAMNVHVASSKAPELPYTKDVIITGFNDLIEQLAQFRPLDPAKEKQDIQDGMELRQYIFSNGCGLTFTLNPGSKFPAGVLSVVKLDGTPENRAAFVLNSMTVMAALTPDWSGQQRGEIGKAIGLTGKFPPEGNQMSLSRGGMSFVLANFGQNNVVFAITPDTPAQ